VTQPAEPSGPSKGSVSLDALLPPTGKKTLEPVTPPPLAQAGGPIIPGMTPLDAEDIKKAETLSDLRLLFPELQNDGSNTYLMVERTFPKVRNNIKVDGFVAKCHSVVNGHDVLTESGFREAFGWGGYIVWVEGPSRKKIDPVTGMPSIIRKTNGEIKLNLAEVQVTQQQPAMFVPGGYGNSAVDLERVKGENALSQRVVDHALNASRGPGDTASAAVAAEAVRNSGELARQTIEQQAAQLQALQAHIYQLQEKLTESNRGAPQDNELLKFMLSRGSNDSDQLRLRYEDQIERMRRDYDDRLERQRADYEGRLRNDRDLFDKNEERIRADFDQKLERANTLAEDRFRQEREHHRLVQESKAKDFETSLAALNNDHAREIEVLRNEAQRNLSNQERTSGMLIQDKQSQIDRLNAEIARLNGELERFRNKEQKPLHVQIQELRGLNELVDSLAPQRDEAPPPKESAADKLLGALATPQGVQAMAPLLMGIAQRAGVIPPGAAPTAPAPQLPNGQPAPRQMGPAQPQQRPQQRPRGARNPVSTPEMPFRDPSVPPPPSPPDNVSPGSPAPQATVPVRRPVFKKQPAFTKEQFEEYLPKIETAAFQAAQDRADPVAFATLTHQFLGADNVSKFLEFTDGENFSLLLDAITKGERGWGTEPRIQWVREVWAALEAMPRAAAPQSEPVEPPAQA